MIRLPRIIKNGTPGSSLNVYDASINLNITPLSTATLTMAEGTQVNSKTYVELFTENGSVGVFRTRSPRTGYGGQLTTVELDHSIAELGDYLINDSLEQDTSLSSAIKMIFGYYRGDSWKLGSIAKGSTSVVLDADHESCLDALLAVLEQEPSVMLSFSFSSYPWTVSVTARPTTVTAEGRLSRNVKSATIVSDDTELCTRVYMESLPGAKDDKYGYIDADTKSKYGIVEKVLTGSNFTEAQAKRAANIYLEKHKEPSVSISINAIDLAAITGETLDTFAIGKKMRLALPDFSRTVEETITQLSWSSVYRNPSSVTVSLSDEEEKAYLTVADTAKEAKSGASRAGGAVKKSNEYWETRVSKVVDKDGNIKAASITLAINEDNESECRIDADKVYIGNKKSTTVINGKCSLSDVSADYIQTKISSITNLRVQTLTSYGEIYVGNSVGMSTSVRSMYASVAKSESGNNITLKFTRLNGQSYASDSVTFSRAVASWGQSWSGGNFTTKALPQNQSCWTAIVGGTASWDGRTVTIPIKAYNSNSPGTEVSTGYSVSATFTLDKSDISIPTSWSSSSSDPGGDVKVSLNKNYKYHKCTVTVLGQTKTIRVQLT